MNHAKLNILLALVLSSVQAQEPDRLRSLRDSYRSAVERTTAPLTNTYLTELEKLKTDLTKKGDLQGALAVDSEIKALSSTAKPEESNGPTPSKDGKHVSLAARKAIERRFVGRMWAQAMDLNDVRRPFLYFRADGSVTRRVADKGLAHGKWIMNDDGIVEVQKIGGRTSWVSFDSETTASMFMERGKDAKPIPYAVAPDEPDPGKP